METVIHQNATGALEKFPRDLRSWFTTQELAELASEAAELISGRECHPDDGLPQPQDGPTRMLMVLTCCYVIGCWESEDVEWATENDPFIQQVSQKYIGWQEIRRFRQAHRPSIEQSLVHVLMTAIHRFPDRIPAGALIANPADVYDTAISWARRRIELAIMMDTAASD